MRFHKTTALAVLLAILFICGDICLAFNVSPIIIELNAEPGKSLNGSFTVFAGADPEKVYLGIQDWDKTIEGGYKRVKSGTMERSCAEWVALSSTVVEVSPQTAKTAVRFTVDVPRNATGSYWTYIIASPAEPNAGSGKNALPKSGMQVDVNVNIGIRLVITVKSGENTIGGEIQKISVARAAPGATDTFEAQVVFDNTGNTYMKTIGYFEIRNSASAVVFEKKLDEISILPERGRLVRIGINKDLPAGKYVALAMFDFGGDSIVAAESKFEVSANIPPPSAADNIK